MSRAWAGLRSGFWFLPVMEKVWTHLRSSFWFLPGVIVIAAAVLAVLMTEIDERVSKETLHGFPRVFGAGAEGSRELLSAIASSTITVAGVVFSITIVALSLTAAQYSPRVLRNFMRDRSNQLVLGIFVGIFTYCLLVLRTIQGGEDAFIPGLSVIAGILLALVGIGFLIYFIHHIATSIQVSHITARIAKETNEAIDRLFPQDLGEELPVDMSTQIQKTVWHPIPAADTGYIQQVDTEALLKFACRYDVVVCMEHGIGEFIIAGQPLVSLPMSNQVDDEAVEAVNRIFGISMYRNIQQDTAFGIQQLVDIALKALSPGVNDTNTAKTSLDYLTAILYRLARRRIEEPYRFDQGKLRVVAIGPSFSQLVDAAFDPIRRNADGNVQMILALFDAVETIGRTTRNAERRKILLRQARMISDMSDQLKGIDDDREMVKARGLRACNALENPA